MHFHDIARHLDAWLSEYGYGFVAVTSFGEAFGLPLPGESAVIAASALCRRGVMSPFVLTAVVAVAAFLGDNVGYLIGLYAGRPVVLRLGRRFGVTTARLDRVEAAFKRHGAWVIVGARFVVGLRQLNGIGAGIVRLPWPRFALANAVGAVLWAAVWSIGPYYVTGWATGWFASLFG